MGRPPASRAFVLLLCGRTVSMVGNAVAPIALAFAVFRLGGDAGDLGLVTAARTVPQVAFLLYGGMIADRLPRRTVLAVASTLAGLAQATAAALLLAGAARIWQLGVLEAVNGAAAAVLFPTSQSALPQTVAADDLQRANALFRLSRNASNVLGAALGGLAVAAYGTGAAIAFDAATFFLAAVLWSGMRLAPVRRAGAREPSLVRRLAEGWGDVRSRTWFWTIVVQFCFVNAAFSGVFQVLGPLVAEERLGGAATWGLVVGAQATGLATGSIAMIWLRAKRPLLAGNTGVLFIVPSLLLLGAGAPLGVLIAAMFLNGLGAEVFGVNWDLMMQREIPPDRLGRMYSYDALGSYVFLPVGQALAGPAQALLGLSGAIWAAAAIIGVATLAIYTVPDVRALSVSSTAAA